MRTSKTQLLGSIFSTFVMCGYGGVSFAQEGVVSELVVTATKRAESVREVPFSLDVLSGRQLDDIGAVNFADFVPLIPSLDFSATIPGQNRLSIRGISALDGASTVGIYLDETPVTSGQETQIDAVLYDLERVEVLRGPQGTLYGEGSIGGTIRFITNKPDPDSFAARGNLTGSTTRNGGENYAVDGAVNIPIAEDVAAVRIVGYSRHDEGFIENLGLGKDDINDSGADGARAALRLNVSEGLTIDASILWNKLETTGVPIIEPGSSFTHTRPLTESSEDEYLIYNLTVSWDLGPVSLTSSSSYFDRELETLAFLPAFGGLANSFTTESESFTQEVRLVSNIDGPFQWLIGGFYKDSDLTTDNPIFFALPGDMIGPMLADSLVDSEQTQWAVFGEASYRLWDRLKLTLGLRYYEEELDASTFVAAPLLSIPPLSFDESQSLSVLTPKFAASLDITDELTGYVHIAQGFRGGGVNSNPLAPPMLARTFDEDSVWNYEAGLKGEFADGLISASGSFYYIDFSDYQANVVPLIIGGGVIDNVGEAHSLGLEGEVTLRPLQGLELTAAGNWNEAEMDVDAVGQPVPTKGNRLPLVPEYTFSLSGQYRFDVTSDVEGYFGGEVSFNGKTYESIANLLENDSYVLANFRVGMTTDHFGIRVFVDNAFDELVSYRNLGFGFFTNQPRTVGITLSANY